MSNINLIFDKSTEKTKNNFIPALDIEGANLSEILPEKYQRNELPIPNIPEIEIVRHYINLSLKNYGVDTGLYPLGSCTMKYNPKINEVIARLPGFSQIHPLQEESNGCLELLFHLESDRKKNNSEARFY